MAEKIGIPLYTMPSIRHMKRKLPKWASLLAAVVLTALCLVIVGRMGKAIFSRPAHVETVIDAINLGGTENWEGWDKLDNLFVFGETNSATGFDVEGTQPGPGNPFGNPEDPDSKGTGRPKTGPIGPIWVHWAAMQYNRSFINTYDFASGGATVDRDLVSPVFPTASTFGDQIARKFEPHHGAKSNNVTWIPKHSLFACFFGVMDLIISFHNLDRTPVSRVMDSYRSALSQLYDLGARNFVIFTVPPVDHPYKAGKPGVRELGEDVKTFNMLLRKMRVDFMKTNRDSNMFLLDTHALFDAVIRNPKAFGPTSGITYTRGPCPAYDLGIGFEGQPDLKRYDPKCGVPVNKYLWHDFIHPTYPMQEVIAQVMVEHCMAERRMGFCA